MSARTSPSLLTIAFTTVCWILTAYLFGPKTDKKTLVEFYKKVRPFGPGWNAIRKEAGIPAGTRGPGDNIPLALLGWFAGCTAIWAALFTVGNFLYGRMSLAMILLAVFLVSGGALFYVFNRLWTNDGNYEKGTPS
jgi:SSS family solute:Na+ symporter